MRLFCYFDAFLNSILLLTRLGESIGERCCFLCKLIWCWGFLIDRRLCPTHWLQGYVSWQYLGGLFFLLFFAKQLVKGRSSYWCSKLNLFLFFSCLAGRQVLFFFFLLWCIAANC